MSDKELCEYDRMMLLGDLSKIREALQSAQYHAQWLPVQYPEWGEAEALKKKVMDEAEALVKRLKEVSGARS
jgi:hypothetical protein